MQEIYLQGQTVDPKNLPTSLDTDLVIKLICQLLAGGGGGVVVTVANGASFNIPPFDEEDFTYVNSGAANDDLIATIVYKKAGATVATLTFTYFGSTNNIQKISQS